VVNVVWHVDDVALALRERLVGVREIDEAVRREARVDRDAEHPALTVGRADVRGDVERGGPEQ
jgi:hypothetical protein